MKKGHRHNSQAAVMTRPPPRIRRVGCNTTAARRRLASWMHPHKHPHASPLPACTQDSSPCHRLVHHRPQPHARAHRWQRSDDVVESLRTAGGQLDLQPGQHVIKLVVPADRQAGRQAQVSQPCRAMRWSTPTSPAVPHHTDSSLLWCGTWFRVSLIAAAAAAPHTRLTSSWLQPL